MVGFAVTVTELITEVNDPDAPWVGPFLKNRVAEDLGFKGYDSEPEIMDLLARYGITVNEDGYARSSPGPAPAA
jgi:hypothetical protein